MTSVLHPVRSEELPPAPAPVLRLSVPLGTRFDAAPAYRVGPDRLPSDAMTDAVDVRWAAYWYHKHDASCMTTCCCWRMTDSHVDFAFNGGGDGVLFVQFANGDIGVYSLAHTREEPSVDWARFRSTRFSRLSPAQFGALRRECDGVAPAFGHPDLGGYTPPEGASAIWEAWDTAVRHFGGQNCQAG